MLSNRLIALLILLNVPSSLHLRAAVGEESNRPDNANRLNVVLILADDLGWSDTTLYGTTQFYQTPNIQRLAERGMTFTRAYSASPLCSPTRASILTGLSPARHGITTPGCHLPTIILEASSGNKAPPSQKAVPVNSVTRFSTEYQTLPRTLKAAGYVTGHFGKWHLGHPPYSPLEHGFDVDIPHHPGPGPAGSYVAPWKFADFDHDPDIPDQHIEDRMALEAVEWMEQHQHQPFFLNYWMFSVHAPFDAKKALIEKYRQQIDAQNPQRSPTYAAMIESMDDAIGTLLDALDRLKLADRTIIVFASDNGGNMYNEVDGTTPTSNAPLRGGKATMFEGGVRTPAVIVWPGTVPGGSVSDATIQSCDFYPTLIDILHLRENPTTANSLPSVSDGISIVPALRGQPLSREAIFTYFPHNPRVPDWLPPAVSVHKGNWKLIRLFFGGEANQHAWKLFHLADDPGEQHNLADQFPDRVSEMDRMIEQFLIDTQAVQPTPNPAFDPSQHHPEMIGKAVPKPSGPQKGKGTAARKQTTEKPVAGWVPMRHCRLTTAEDGLLITSSGQDPHLSFRLPAPLPAGTYRLQLVYTATARGKGQFFWQEQGVPPQFIRDRSVTFAMQHDQTEQSADITFTSAKSIPTIRLDPGQGQGTVILHSVQLTNTTTSKPAWKWPTRK